ncbi:MAG: hypothetical protein ACJAQ4_000166 [Cryomorphaceae bacterium]|jgi:hypothetical protein
MKTFLTLLLMLCLWNVHSQSTITYTVDEDFSTEQTLRSKTSVFDIYPLEDGGFFLGGGFTLLFSNPDSPFIQGLAMITQNGSTHPDWGGGQSIFCRELHVHNGGFISATGEFLSKELFNGDSWFFTFGDIWGDYFKTQPWGIGNNPYEVRWTQDIFILEDQSVLIGGAIATDTMQPSLFRHLMRLLPDGSHDDTFPIVEAMPQGLNTHISKIERASDGSWYVSGRFEGINGHISPHIAHVTANFEVDTDFVSPFYYESICCGLHTELKLLDSQDRLWFGGGRVRLESNLADTLQLVRLLPDGLIDSSFEVGKADSRIWNFGTEQPPWINGVFERENGDFFIYGTFSHYNDTPQHCISSLDDEGIIQQNYFNGEGATINYYDPDDETDVARPSIHALELLEDGSLLVGGAFSDFMGVERYSMVKLNQGTVGTSDRDRLEGKVKVYPNPADQFVQLEFELFFSKVNTVMNVYDQLGRKVSTYTIGTNTQGVEILDTRKLVAGLYIVEIVQEGKQVFSDKFIVQH